MTLSVAEENNTRIFHSHAILVNPHKEGVIERICRSEPFIKPTMSLKEVTFISQKIMSFCKFKKPQSDPQQTDSSIAGSKTIPREPASELHSVFQDQVCSTEEMVVQLDIYKPREKMQMTITDDRIRTMPTKNKSEFLPLKQFIRSKHKSKKGGLQIPKKDWEKIRTLSAKVILDPNTANPALKLSQDRRSVRTKTYEEYHSSQSYYEYHRKCSYYEYHRKYKHQYNGWLCVQAQEGYSTGRHYWEVDVKRKCDWRVGVVKESAPCNGFVKLNTETGYWTLCLQLGSLIALTEPVTKLNHMVSLVKIGVHLDLEEGQVSFYNAVKRKHIYTFIAEFSKCEKIYPVFGTVETDRPLKII